MASKRHADSRTECLNQSPVRASELLFIIFGSPETPPKYNTTKIGETERSKNRPCPVAGFVISTGSRFETDHAERSSPRGDCGLVSPAADFCFSQAACLAELGNLGQLVVPQERVSPTHIKK
eukprot:2517562-Amphidinium_carterae.1